MEQRKTQPSWIATADKQESGWTGGAAWPPVIAHDDPADKEIVVLMNWQGHCGNGGLAVRLCLCFFLQCGMSLSLCFVSGGSRRRCYLCHRYICGGAVPLLRFVLLPTRISSCTLGHCFRVGGNTLHSWRLSSSTRVLLTVTSLCAVSTDKGALLRASISVVSIILAAPTVSIILIRSIAIAVLSLTSWLVLLSQQTAVVEVSLVLIITHFSVSLISFLLISLAIIVLVIGICVTVLWLLLLADQV